MKLANVGALFVAAAAVYSWRGCLNGDFVYDDEFVVLKHGVVSGSKPWTHAFLTDYWGAAIDSPYSHGSYRPITTLFLRAAYFLGPKDDGATSGVGRPSPVPFHALTLLFHALSSMLVFALAKLALNQSSQKISYGAVSALAFLGGIVFAVHPLLSEAVCNIACTADALAGFFTLLTTWLVLTDSFSSSDSSPRFLAGLVSALLATLSKETGAAAFAIPVVAHALKWWLTKSNESKRKTVTSTVTGAMLILLRLRTQGARLPHFAASDNVRLGLPFFAKLLTSLYIFARHYWLAVLPKPLVADWSFYTLAPVWSLSQRGETALILAALTAAILLAFMVFRAVDKARRAPEVLLASLLSSSPVAAQDSPNGALNSPLGLHLSAAPSANSGDDEASTGKGFAFLASGVKKARRNSVSASAGAGAGMDHDDSTVVIGSSKKTAAKRAPSPSAAARKKEAAAAGPTAGVTSPGSSASDLVHLAVALSVFFVLAFAPYAPASGVLFDVGFTMAERLMYTPLAGLVLLVLVGTAAAFGDSKATSASSSPASFGAVLLLGIAVAIAAVSERMNMTRAVDFSTSPHFWSGIIRDNPKNAKALYSLAVSFEDGDEAERVIARPLATALLQERYGLVVEEGVPVSDDTLATMLFRASLSVLPDPHDYPHLAETGDLGYVDASVRLINGAYAKGDLVGSLREIDQVVSRVKYVSSSANTNKKLPQVLHPDSLWSNPNTVLSSEESCALFGTPQVLAPTFRYNQERIFLYATAAFNRANVMLELATEKAKALQANTPTTSPGWPLPESDEYMASAFNASLIHPSPHFFAPLTPQRLPAEEGDPQPQDRYLRLDFSARLLADVWRSFGAAAGGYAAAPRHRRIPDFALRMANEFRGFKAYSTADKWELISKQWVHEALDDARLDFYALAGVNSTDPAATVKTLGRFFQEIRQGTVRGLTSPAVGIEDGTIPDPAVAEAAKAELAERYRLEAEINEKLRLATERAQKDAKRKVSEAVFNLMLGSASSTSAANAIVVAQKEAEAEALAAAEKARAALRPAPVVPNLSLRCWNVPRSLQQALNGTSSSPVDAIVQAAVDAPTALLSALRAATRPSANVIVGLIAAVNERNRRLKRAQSEGLAPESPSFVCSCNRPQAAVEETRRITEASQGQELPEISTLLPAELCLVRGPTESDSSAVPSLPMPVSTEVRTILQNLRAIADASFAVSANATSSESGSASSPSFSVPFGTTAALPDCAATNADGSNAGLVHQWDSAFSLSGLPADPFAVSPGQAFERLFEATVAVVQVEAVVEAAQSKGLSISAEVTQEAREQRDFLASYWYALDEACGCK